MSINITERNNEYFHDEYSTILQNISKLQLIETDEIFAFGI